MGEVLPESSLPVLLVAVADRLLATAALGAAVRAAVAAAIVAACTWRQRGFDERDSITNHREDRPTAASQRCATLEGRGPPAQAWGWPWRKRPERLRTQRRQRRHAS